LGTMYRTQYNISDTDSLILQSSLILRCCLLKGREVDDNVCGVNRTYAIALKRSYTETCTRAEFLVVRELRVAVPHSSALLYAI